ncbi:MAG: cation-transporting P-type ATPase [Nitrospirota bacterium]
MKPWYQLTAEQALERAQSSHDGLSAAEAARRRQQHGPNRLKEEARKSGWSILFSQFTDLMIIILLAAAAIAWGMGDLVDAAMILVIVALNASLGFGQEYRAERALAALRRLEQPDVVVRRGGAFAQIASYELVPGDVVAVNEGQRIPADGRLLEAVHLQVDESQLTGESIPVTKHARPLPERDVVLGDRINMVFMGSTATTGHGWAVVAETGMRTELGKIAHLLQVAEERKTPLQLKLARLGFWLAVIVVALTAAIFAAGVLRGEPPEAMLLTAISLAVAAIPEGLPAVTAIVLAVGAQAMIRRRALVRKLPAVETLGSVTAICADKTGTLTQNLMAVELIWCDGRLIDVTGDGYAPSGAFLEAGAEIVPKNDPALFDLLRAAVLCNNGRLQQDGGQWTVFGDPTEGALLVAGAKAGLWKDQLGQYPRIAEIPFDSHRKRMTTIHKGPDGRFWLFSKGTIEEMLHRSADILEGGAAQPLTRQRRERVMRVHHELAGDGVRVLACAMRPLKAVPSDGRLEEAERELLFLGLFGIMDPPRPEAKAAVATCRQAGIRPVMVTGDHRITAEAIAAHLGIHDRGDRMVTGEELESMSEEELERLAPRISVYARVTPEQKVNIVQALKRRGDVVAMTGDGVNDAPALRMADIGVAMGRKGTDVAREASDVVLLDDNFATIVSAVEAGRVIYDNIRKFTRYMLATNSGEVLTVFFAMLFGLPLPLLPVHILWINLVSDGLPALALGMEPPERHIMRRPPRHPAESMFAGGLGAHVAWVGLLMGLGTIAVFDWAHGRRDLSHAQTMAFLTLTLFQMFHVLAIRSERDPLWVIGLWSNSKLLGAVALVILLQAAITYVPWLQPVFHTAPLTPGELLLCVAVASTVYVAVEGEKWWRARGTLPSGADR